MGEQSQPVTDPAGGPLMGVVHAYQRLAGASAVAAVALDNGQTAVAVSVRAEASSQWSRHQVLAGDLGYLVARDAPTILGMEWK